MSRGRSIEHDDGREWITDTILRAGGAINFFSARFAPPQQPQSTRDPSDSYSPLSYDDSHLKPDSDEEGDAGSYWLNYWG